MPPIRRSTGSGSRRSPGPTRRAITATCSAAARSPARSSDDEIARAASRDGKKLPDALAEAGYAGRPRDRLEPQRYLGYFEAHIEQGGTLEATGKRIGVVEAIIGNWNYWVTVTGEQNHAGTTEMHRRKDAAAALVRLAARIHDRFAEIARDHRARCGRSGAS